MECLTDDAAQAHLLLQQAFTQWAGHRVVVGFPRLRALEHHFRVWRVVVAGRRFYVRQRCVVQEVFQKWCWLLLFGRRR
jgi:hypothetical protein